MCGLAGYLSGAEPPDPGIVERMTVRLAHRGPDAGGVCVIGPVALGHRRLSVIDLSEANNQPFFDSSGRVAIVFNGEIYNFREIRATLEAAGAIFRTSGDTEVVVEAYKQWGTACLDRFNGMFAFAIWDAGVQRLFLARDRLGEKPLYVAALPEGGLAFASEPRALREHPALSRGIDSVALAHYLALNYTVGERTLHTGIRRLPPAHYLLAGAGKPVTMGRYWDLGAAFRDKRSFASEAAAAEELGELIDDCVRLRMVSDVPLGAFLSGGIDSSAVVSAMARLLPPGQVHTFSMGFGEPSFDEVDAARAVARHFGLDHKDEIAQGGPAESLEAIVHAADEPLADSSVVPTYYLARFARQHVTVALSGDGGDECFAGYETYVADRLHRALHWLPGAVVGGASRLSETLLPVSLSKVSLDYKIRHFLASLHLPFPRAHASWRNIFSAREREELMQPHWREALARDPDADPFLEFERHFREVPDIHYLDQASYVDIKTWLPDDILVKVDRATMAHSLEARAPLLDHRLVEFAARLPPHWKLKGFSKKHLLRLSQRRRVPGWVLERRKQGFNAPVTQWLMGPLRELARETLSTPAMAEWFRTEAVERLWKDQDAGLRDNGLKLFGLLTVALWIRGT